MITNCSFNNSFTLEEEQDFAESSKKLSALKANVLTELASVIEPVPCRHLSSAIYKSGKVKGIILVQ